MTETATPEVIPCPEEISLELGAWHPEARGRVGEAFGIDHFALRVRVEVQTLDGKTVTVLAEHGHALDVYNRHSDPYDQLDTPAGDHVVQEALAAFLGRSLRDAASVYGGTPEDDEVDQDPLGSQRRAGLPTASAGWAGAAPDEPAR